VAYRIKEGTRWGVKSTDPSHRHATQQSAILMPDAGGRNERFAGGRVGPSRRHWARASSVDRHTEHLSVTICCAASPAIDPSSRVNIGRNRPTTCCCYPSHARRNVSFLGARFGRWWAQASPSFGSGNVYLFIYLFYSSVHIKEEKHCHKRNTVKDE